MEIGRWKAWWSGWIGTSIIRIFPLETPAEFLRKVVRGLMARFAIADVGVLALDRFRLRDEVEARFQQHRDSERRTAF